MTQAELVDQLSMTVGGFNYCLYVLIDNGLVKMQNFSRSKNKSKFVCLMPMDIAEQAVITHRFLPRKTNESEALRVEIGATLLNGQKGQET
jgi:hypothetical protein